MTDKTVGPTCPKCGAEGVEHICSAASEAKSHAGDSWFEVAYCAHCGHIYGVFPKVIYGSMPSWVDRRVDG